MIYYAKDNKVYSCDILLADDSFQEITKEEYERRISVAFFGREQGIPADNSDML